MISLRDNLAPAARADEGDDLVGAEPSTRDERHMAFLRRVRELQVSRREARQHPQKSNLTTSWRTRGAVVVSVICPNVVLLTSSSVTQKFTVLNRLSRSARS